jgi:serine/threonine protein kinase
MEVTYEKKLAYNSGYIYTISDKILGKGSYGNVYLGKNQYNDKIAIKCCLLNDKGISNILEASIMKTISHPNINNAIEIFCVDTKLYIIQELAVTDLYMYTNKNKMYNVFTINEILYIFYSLIQAVSILHNENIIHCDIKPSNVLIYSDNQIKLTDFSLSTIKTNNTKLHHQICTPTYRPLECHCLNLEGNTLYHQGWDEKIDIWSLGCTFYEILYNEDLFPNQSNLNKQLYSKHTNKLITKKKYINTIINWSNITNQHLDFNFFDINHENIKLSDKYNNEEYININALIINMLSINPINRPTAMELLHSHIFKNFSPVNAKFITTSPNKLSLHEQARITRYIEQFTNNISVRNLSYNIYCKLELDTLSELHKAFGTTWIASKLLLDSTSSVTNCFNIKNILKIESDIVHNLHFRLHY